MHIHGPGVATDLLGLQMRLYVSVQSAQGRTDI